MGMSITAKSFIFDNISLANYSMIICSIDSSDGVVNTKVASDISLTTQKSNSSDISSITNKSYSEDISFEFDICKYDKYSMQACEIPNDEVRAIARWLHQSKNLNYRKFQFENITNGYDLVYYADCINVEKVFMAGKIIGLHVSFVTNAPYGWTTDKIYTHNMSTSNDTMIIYNDDDEVMNYTYPNLQITMKENTDFSIYNNLTNETFKIKNCINGEIININGKTLEITSSRRNGTEILNNFNNVFFSLVNTYNNQINILTINGMANISIICKFIRKVGV